MGEIGELTERYEADFFEMQRQQETAVWFVYTPFCGTCHIAERMMGVVAKLAPQLPYYKINANYAPVFNKELQIQSVPAVILLHQGVITRKHYAVHSVDFLLQEIRNFREL